ncbi:lycopene cyclase domain-containing protein [Candidatus Micrarchaeota archaeon]|nr:lycopene cyclase domain-containing protein [Candidatus Micrarchaeota archaeon]
MEYTFVSLGMLILAAGLNMAYNPAFRRRKTVLVAVSMAALAQVVFDNVTVAAGFWEFNDAATLGIRIPFMPLENLFFGLALFLFTIFFFEHFKNQGKSD